jgi:cob(I)alamin adenosyltransferase
MFPSVTPIFNTGRIKSGIRPNVPSPAFRRFFGAIVIFYSEQRSGMIRDTGLGLLHLYYGAGVGKTSRVVGLAVRAAGAGIRVDFVQFMKSGGSAEVAAFERLPEIHYRCPGRHPFILSRGPDQRHYEHAASALSMAHAAVRERTRLLICDEILDTLLFGLLEERELMDLADRCKGRVELVMTGRKAPAELLARADYATEFVQIKHPYYTGAKARKGIEY